MTLRQIMDMMVTDNDYHDNARPIFRTLARMCQADINYAAREEKRTYTNSR